MNKKSFFLTLFAILAFFLPRSAAPCQPADQPQAGHDSQQTNLFVPRPRLVGQRGANEKVPLPGDGDLPEAASALPLLSAIGAGALLGGLLSVRSTRRSR